MPTYLARVELYNAEPEDYEGLHKYMLSLGFRRTIPHGDGSYNQLPDGTYVSEKGGDIYQIRSQISDYADRLSVSRVCFCLRIQSMRMVFIPRQDPVNILHGLLLCRRLLRYHNRQIPVLL